MKNVATVKKTNEILVQFGLHAKKNFGQNFLVVQKTVNDIIELSDIDKDSVIIEIGPGVGALTDVLLDKFKRVICFEIDSSLIEPLQYTFSDKDNFELYNKDILKVDLNKFIEDNLKNEKVVIFSNLPYYITSEILIKLFNCKNVTKIVTMMQKEVAHRILTADKGKDENELTLLAKHYCDFKLVKEVSKNDFFPKPHIDSTVLAFKIKQNVSDINEIIKVLFKQRRKTIYNNLSSEYNKNFVLDLLKKLKIDQNKRSEDLTVLDIEKIDAYIKGNLLFAPAKINLNLQVFDKVDDKHELRSIVQKIDLYDEIIVNPSNELIIETRDIPQEKNIIYKAIKEYEKHINDEIKLYIKVIKNIPSEAGLGGGSSDAAAILMYLNNIYHLDEKELIDIAIKVGSDVPLFLKEGTVEISKTGEELISVIDNSKFYYLLVKDNFGINTGLCYKKFDEINEKEHFNFEIIKEGLKNNDFNMVLSEIKNDLLKPALSIENRISKLLKINPNAFMTGSGSAVVIPFDNFEKCEELFKEIVKKHLFVKIVQKV